MSRLQQLALIAALGILAGPTTAHAATIDAPAVVHTRVVHTGVVHTGVVHTGVVHTGVVHTGVVHTLTSDEGVTALAELGLLG